MNIAERLLYDLNHWLQGVLLRGVAQLSVDELSQLESMEQIASSLRMDTLAQLLQQQQQQLLQQQQQQLHNYLLHAGDQQPVVAAFFRLSAYARMAENTGIS
ncbi:hypothetical protein ACE3MZ_09930 [Paenibacillus sp. WLX1005]|uniref:hypothetical protein n=1 Tax=Paenibacillus sp. WLX1005 TaxID=3243766 RepID=UPI0039844461